MNNKVIYTYISESNGELLNIIYDELNNKYLFIDWQSNISESDNLDEILNYINNNYKNFVNVDNEENLWFFLEKYNYEITQKMNDEYFHEMNDNYISKAKYIEYNGVIKYITWKIIKNNILESIRLNWIDLIDLSHENSELKLLDAQSNNKYYIISLLSDIIYDLS